MEHIRDVRDLLPRVVLLILKVLHPEVQSLLREILLLRAPSLKGSGTRYVRLVLHLPKRTELLPALDRLALRGQIIPRGLTVSLLENLRLLVADVLSHIAHQAFGHRLIDTRTKLSVADEFILQRGHQVLVQVAHAIELRLLGDILRVRIHPILNTVWI